MTEKTARHTFTLAGLVITFLGAVLFSTKAIFVKVAFAQTSVDALTLLTLRMVFSLPFYVVTAFLISRRETNIPMNRQQWLYVILLGLCGYYISSLLDFLGLQYITAGLERLILFLYPTFAVLINTLFFRQKLTRNQKWALVLTYAGIATAYAGELSFQAQNPNFFLGSFLVFLCSVTYSIYIVGSGRMVVQTGPAKFTAYAMLASTAGIFVHYGIRGNFSYVKDNTHLWWYGLLLAVVATVIPSFLISNGIKRIGSSNAAIVSSIGPVSTIVQAHFILNEPIFAAQVVGTVVVVFGVIVLGWKRAT